MLTLDKRTIATPDEFVEEAIKLYKWSPEYEKDFLIQPMCDPTWVKLTFKQPTRNKRSYNQRVIQVLCDDYDTCRATLDRFHNLRFWDEAISIASE